MANPFSGLENIGASYMAGARLAQERQRRADEILARQEEARIRQQYYQDIIAEREAARLATAADREAQGSTLFGKYLVRKADGTIDYQASQAAKQAGEERGQLGAAYGALAARDEKIGPISPEIMQTPQFIAARATGLEKRAGEQKAVRNALLSQGYIPVEETPEPFGFTPDLLRAPRDTSEDFVIEGQRFQPGPLARMRATKPVKPTFVGKETFSVLGREVSRDLTKEQMDALVQAYQSGNTGGGTNAPLGDIVVDPNSPYGLRYIPRK